MSDCRPAGLVRADALAAKVLSGGVTATVDRQAPDDLALATLAALQGGLLLTQIQRRTKPLEVALDAMLERVASLHVSA
jgi:lysozyme family protein